ncbi:hypothetical protein FT663_04204 [Candidozyma haemuli var. vulneris]|nr:hypothetical protein FT662_04600 [[Candida] haemuloni var. vulneris]KAF3988033.1 hypothetical protein FT663_04204 [[Candida] haemuloni var. vulneris]
MLFTFDEDPEPPDPSPAVGIPIPKTGKPENHFLQPSSQGSFSNSLGSGIKTGTSFKGGSFQDLHSNVSKSPRVHRRSSVYRRLSVWSTSSTAGITIPSGYNEESESKGRKSLGDFVPLRVLGQGAYGKVHLVKDKHNGRLYAQKQIRKPQIDVHEDNVKGVHVSHIQRTLAERQILTQVTHHANIVKLFYALQDHDRFYLLLEYIPGGELFYHLTSGNALGNVFKEDHVAFYAAEMALGLRHLHSLGIVYRDLKPENCLLNSAGHLVLTDFGLSKAISNDDESACRSIIGTPEYMAPETIRGEAYDYAVDWWSLGCVIYDMMTGKPPFTGKSHDVITKKILSAKLNLPFYLTLDAKDLLNKLLQKKPEKRFQVDEKWDAFTNHRFFRKLNWNAIIAQDDSVVPPIIPTISDPEMAENFSDEFTSMKVSDYEVATAQASGNPQELFQGFSFAASGSYIDKFGQLRMRDADLSV